MARSPLFRLLRRAVAAHRLARRLGTAEVWDLHEEARARAWSRRAFLKHAAVLAAGSGAARPRGSRGSVPVGSPRGPVVVVGAGLAGLTAAWHLAEAGVDVRVFEAQPRTGGRMLSLRGRFPDGQFVELGGELIDSGHDTIRGLAGALGLDLEDLAESDPAIVTETYHFGGARRSEREILEAFGPLAARLSRDLASLGHAGDVTYRTPGGAEALDRLSIAEYLDRERLPRWFRDLLDVAYTTEYGLEIDQQSALNLVLWISPSTDDFAVFGDSDERYRIRGGNDRLTAALAERLKDRVVTGATLEALRQRPDGSLVSSFTHHGRQLEVSSSRVVLALPFTLLREVTLDVPLSSAKRLAIDSMRYGTNAKLMIGFVDRAWRRVHGANGSVMTDLPFQTSWETSRRQPGTAGVLTNFTGGRQGLAVGEGTPEEQAGRVVEALETIFPGVAATRGAAPAVRFHWPTHPWVRGSYAAFAPGQWTGINGAAGEPEGAVFFAGEHCSTRAQGFMEGACETGVTAAADVLRSLGLGERASALRHPRGRGQAAGRMQARQPKERPRADAHA